MTLGYSNLNEDVGSSPDSQAILPFHGPQCLARIKNTKSVIVLDIPTALPVCRWAFIPHPLAVGFSERLVPQLACNVYASTMN